jgi:hypothetical protein
MITDKFGVIYKNNLIFGIFPGKLTFLKKQPPLDADSGYYQ